METDHEDLSKLYKEDPEAFEAERDRLINEAIKAAPEGKREKMRAFQQKVDKIMDAAGSKRLETLELMMRCNIAEMMRQLNGLKDTLNGLK